ncbi:hypothetical protein SDRG_00760 [Saprolegnia diclina VS20]|uniref:Uncharacterized protein n=1 Tax=Saprolegnia diclina (strain VS20) TaxID=1156394 RepID=T0R646_SAPDV|nr:hypothetical protein SDRG_00760 [Saprolegnia diclina VS20]EQC41905.1 hypothetical protein SDRG_00760 [Saprolegnia diclina VS20]|eukprot:XP_008604474.1 hypothetical protein SDRG_00760 [Saprolegnia diclina VS20]
MSFAPITAGYRAALVYHSVGLNFFVGDTSLMPVPRHATIAALATIAATPLPVCERIARPLCYNMHELTFRSLSRTDADFVAILVATKCYDVALVCFTEGTLPYSKKKGFLNTVAACAPHRSCQIPNVVVEHVLGKSAHAFLHDVPQSPDECPAAAILFWPKMCRVSIVGAQLVLPLLKNAVARPKANKLGLDSADDLVGGTIGLVQSMLSLKNATLSLKDAAKMAEALVGCNNVAMADLFIGDVVVVTRWLEFDAAVVMIEKCLAKYGWLALEAAMLRLIQRWVKDDVSSTARLLANLAGATNNSKVAPLQQPFVCEFFKRSWHEVLVHQPTWPTSTIDEYIVLMDGYLHDIAPFHVNGHWLSQKLPPALVSVVDSFLYKHRHGVYTLLSLEMDTKWRLQCLPTFLVKAVALQPALVQTPYLEVIATLADAHTRGDYYATLGFTGVYSLLSCMDRIGRCDEALMDKVRTLCGTDAADAFAYLVTKTPVSAVTRERVAAYLDNKAQRFLDDAVNADAKDHCIVNIVAELVKALDTVAPEKVASFFTQWLPDEPTSLTFTRDQLFPVVEEMAAMYRDKHRDVVLHLATHCRDGFKRGMAEHRTSRDDEDFDYYDAKLNRRGDLQCLATLNALLARMTTTSRKRARRSDTSA